MQLKKAKKATRMSTHRHPCQQCLFSPPSSFTLPDLLQQPPPPTPFGEPALERYAALTTTIQTQAAELSRGIAFSSIGKARPLEPTDEEIAALEQRMGYCFSNPDIRWARRVWGIASATQTSGGHEGYGVLLQQPRHQVGTKGMGSGGEGGVGLCVRSSEEMYQREVTVCASTPF